MNSIELQYKSKIGVQPIRDDCEGVPACSLNEAADHQQGSDAKLSDDVAIISLRTVLQQMELTAELSGLPKPIAETRQAACIKVLVDNNCDLGGSLDTAVISRLANAIGGKCLVSVPGLMLYSADPILKSALNDFLCAYHLCSGEHNAQLKKNGKAPISTQADSILTEKLSPLTDGTAIGMSEIMNGGGSISSLSYGSLLAIHSNGRPNVDKKTIQNETSVLRRIINIMGEDETADCRWMGDHREFEKRLTAHKITDPKLRSPLKKIGATVSSLVESVNPANTLWESYLRLFWRQSKAGGKVELLTKNQFIGLCFNATGIPRRRLNAKKILVHGGTFNRIMALEHSLGGAGELTQWLINMSDNNAQIFQSGYGKRASEAVKFPYALLKKDWSSIAKAEWDDLFLLRTAPTQASRKFHLRLQNVPPNRMHTWRIRKQDGSCSSAVKQCRELECFYGWCLLPLMLRPDGKKNLWRSGPDKRYTKEELSMALVTDQELFDGYIAFRKAHTLTELEVITGQNGTFNRSCKLFIEFTSSLLNPLTGFLYLRKDIYFRPDDAAPSLRNLAPRVGCSFYDNELRRDITVTDPDRRWLCFCKETRSYMELVRATEFDEAYMTRDSAPIAQILALPDPMKAIMELLNLMEDSEPVSGYWKHSHRRKRLFFMLIAVCPLRVLQFAFMDGNHLCKVKSEDGNRHRYQIHFTKEDFKNEEFIPEQDYLFNVPEDFTTFIDDYFANDWPALNGRAYNSKERVFIAEKEQQTITGVPLPLETVNQRIKQQLSKICRESTARHLGAKYKTPGFYPQAFRHIKATSIIKTTGSYEEAALLLWDAVATVKKAYAHVKRIDQLAKASSGDYVRMKKHSQRE